MTGQDTTRDRRWIALILLCVAQFMVVLDAAIMNVALPTIGRALDFSESNLPWVVNAYVLTFGGFLLLGGRMADLLGRRRIFMVGLVVFALASLAGGLATTSGQLIAARAVQGLGAAILSPAALSIVTTTFQDGAERNKALGVWGAVAGSGGAAGVLLGGALTDGLGWQWVLWVNVPIGLAAAAIAPMLLAESRSTGDRRHFDVAGAVSVTAGLSLLVYALVDANSAGWGSGRTIGLLAISAGVASQLVTKVGFKGVMAVGMLLIAAALVWFSQISVQGSFVSDILGPSLLAAVGLGFSFVTTTIAAVSGVADHEAGLASGLINTSQQIGGALGLAILAAISDSVVGTSHDPVTLTNGFSDAFLVGAGFAGLGLIATLVLIKGRDSRAHTELDATAAAMSQS